MLVLKGGWFLLLWPGGINQYLPFINSVCGRETSEDFKMRFSQNEEKRHRCAFSYYIKT